MSDVTVAETEKLSAGERELLASLEATIVRGTRAFAETGRALAMVRDERLYRETHESFEAYAAETFDISRQQAYRLIDAAQVLEAMSPMGDIGDGPRSERQARELAPLKDRPEEMSAAWRSASEAAAAQSRAVTAEDVRAAVRPPAPAQEQAPVRLVAPPENDTRFEMLDDAVELLRMLGVPEEVVFPVQGGDVEMVDDAIRFLSDWTPRVAKAWRAHRAALRQSRAA